MSKRHKTSAAGVGAEGEGDAGGGRSSGSSSAGSFDVCVRFADGDTVTVRGLPDGATIAQLRQAASEASGRTVTQLFDLDAGDETALADHCSARELSSNLVGVESACKIVVVESLGAGCTDAQFEELCGSAAAVSCESMNVDGCRSITGTVQCTTP